MLVLSRKVGESIVIGDGIRIVVNRIAGHKVTLGLLAPDEVKIVRGELVKAEPPKEDHDGKSEAA